MSMEIKNAIEALSGKNDYGKPKAFFSLTHSVEGSDGSIQEKEHLFIDKPVIKIFRSLSQVVVDFIYEFPKDVDLRRQWEFLNHFYSPDNSVYYSGEDVEKAMNEDGTFKEVLYNHALVLNISSKEPKGKYVFQNFGQMLYCSLISLRPGEPQTVIRMAFDTNETVLDELNDEDLRNLNQAAVREAEMEVRNEA